MSADRPIRDILAECARTANLGRALITWASIGDDGREEQRRIADRLIGQLERHGLRICRVGDPDPAPAPPTSPVIYADKIIGREAERQIRRGKDGAWEVLKVEGGNTAVQMTITLQQAYLLAGRALQGDATVKDEPGAYTVLATALEVHRCDAVQS